MFKKLFLTSAALLSVAGMYAQDNVAPATNMNDVFVKDGIQYKVIYTSFSTTGRGGNSKPEEVTVDQNSNTISYFYKDISTSKQRNYEINLEVIGIESTNQSISINDFNITKEVTIAQDGGKEKVSISKNNPEFEGYIDYARDASDNVIFTYEEAEKETNRTKDYYFADEKTEVPESDLNNYYYFRTTNTAKYGLFIAIENLIVTDQVISTTPYNCNYHITSIGSEIINGNSNIESITFGSNVNNIAPGAFIGANNLYKVQQADNSASQNFIWNRDFGMLFNNAKTEVIYANCNSDKTLPASVETIYDYAFVSASLNAQGEKITITGTKVGINVNTDTQGDNVIFNIPTAFTANFDGTGTVYSGTVLTASDFDLSGLQGLYADFTEVTFRCPVTINNASDANNIMYYFPASATVNGTNKNVVIGGNCATFSLTDKQPYYNLYKFNTSNAYLDRQIATGIKAAVILPFSLELDTKEYWIGKYENLTDGTLNFSRVYTMEANKPYYFENKSGKANPFSSTKDLVIAASAGLNLSSNDNVFRGTYSTITLATDGSDYGYTAAGNFIQCKGNSLPAFRAYFHNEPAKAPSMRFFDEFENEVAFESNETAISAVEVENNSEVIYNANGQQVKDMTAPGAYIVNGKKVIVK